MVLVLASGRQEEARPPIDAVYWPVGGRAAVDICATAAASTTTARYDDAENNRNGHDEYRDVFDSLAVGARP